MKRIGFVLLIVSVSGCVTSLEPVKSSPTELSTTPKPLTRIDEVRKGMSIEEVMSMMEPEHVVGYRQKGSTENAFERILIKGPYRREDWHDETGKYNIFYYFTDVVKPDGLISEEELTPVIMKDSVVVGKGKDFLYRLKNRGSKLPSS